MEEKKTLKELYHCEYIVSEEELYPLQEWYNQLIDKTVDEITLFDTLRMLRQDTFVDLALLKVIEYLQDNVFAGDAYDGQVLETLLRMDGAVLMPYVDILQRIVVEAYEQCEKREWSSEGEKAECDLVLKELCADVEATELLCARVLEYVLEKIRIGEVREYDK